MLKYPKRAKPDEKKSGLKPKVKVVAAARKGRPEDARSELPSGIVVLYLLGVLLFSGMQGANLIVKQANAVDAMPGDALVVPAGPAPRQSDMQQALTPIHEVPARLVANGLAAPGASCLLSETKLREAGGRFSVVAVRPDGVVLQWAGGATAASAPCPPGRLLLLGNGDFRALQAWLLPPAAAYLR